MSDFIVVTVNGEPYAIKKDWIAGFCHNRIFVKRNMYYEIDCAESYNQIRDLINGYKGVPTNVN